MDKSKKIVFIGFLSGFGGAQKATIMVANGLANLGNRVTLITLKNNNIVYEIDERIECIFIPDYDGKKIKKQHTRFLNLKNNLSEIKPHLVISFWLQPIIFASILSKSIGFKTLYSERTDPTSKQYGTLLKILRNLSFRVLDGIVFQTQGARNCFSKWIQNKGSVINNPVSIKYEDYTFPTTRRKVIVNVGRLHEQKNQKLLIDAFSKISENFPEYILEIYGEGHLENQLKSQIKELGLESRVVLKGTTRNLYNEIVNSSLFVLSSDYEGMPNALMEAMALGIPSISTDCKPGGARELINNGENGFITSPNSVNELAEAMKYMLEDTQDAENMAKKAKQICNTHSERTIFKMWDKYITKIIN